MLERRWYVEASGAHSVRKHRWSLFRGRLLRPKQDWALCVSDYWERTTRFNHKWKRGPGGQIPRRRLGVERGTVRVRVAFLPRSAEIQPFVLRFVFFGGYKSEGLEIEQGDFSAGFIIFCGFGEWGARVDRNGSTEMVFHLPLTFFGCWIFWIWNLKVEFEFLNLNFWIWIFEFEFEIWKKKQKDRNGENRLGLAR